MWDREIFIKNVLELVRKHCGGNQKKFGVAIGDRDSVTKWKAGKGPSVEVLMRIPEKFPCSLDWLLTGNVETKDRELPDELNAIMPDLAYIFSSRNEGVRLALKINIEELRKSVRKDETDAENKKIIKEGKKKIENLEARIDHLEQFIKQTKKIDDRPATATGGGDGTKSEKKKT